MGGGTAGQQKCQGQKREETALKFIVDELFFFGRYYFFYSLFIHVPLLLSVSSGIIYSEYNFKEKHLLN